MSEDLREDVKATIRKHDPDAETLKKLASDLEKLAERYDTQDEIL